MSAPIPALVGPTAGGKSALALALAEEHGWELVSCDSRQLYRGLDIGTAKPSAHERARVPHHLLDVADPREVFSAARWAQLAEAAIAEVRARGKVPLVVGGTGLYLRALRFGLADAPPRDEALRALLVDEEAATPGILHRRLADLDPATAARLGPRDLQRVVRALEVHALTGRPLSAHFADQPRGERLPMRVVVLDPGPALASRIAARAETMLAAGLVDEVRRIHAASGPDAPGLDAVGYREVAQLLAGELAEPALLDAIVRSTKRYARRQRTWFRAEPEAVHVAEPDAARRALLVGE